MTTFERFLVTCVLLMLAIHAVSQALWLRMRMDLQMEARLAWEEVQRLRATMAAHGINPDFSEPF